jgi:hypothetical protein
METSWSFTSSQGRMASAKRRSRGIDEDDDMLSAMARELVEKNGIGENADAIWRALNAEHQKLFPTSSDGDDDAASIQLPVILLNTQPDPAGRVEGAMGTASIVVFGQRPQSLSGKRRRTRPPAPEQASLFSLN